MNLGLNILGVIFSYDETSIDNDILTFCDKPQILFSIIQSSSSKYIKKTIIVGNNDKIKDLVNNENNIQNNLDFFYSNQPNNTDEYYDILNNISQHFQKKEKIAPDIIIDLHPSFPTRSLSLIENTIDNFIINYENYDSLQTVTQVDCKYDDLVIIDNNILQLISGNKSFKSLNKSKIYYKNKMVTIYKVKSLKKEISSWKTYPFIIDNCENYKHNILEDWSQSKKIILRKKKRKNNIKKM